MVSSNKKLTLYAAVAWILTILAFISRLLSRLLSYNEGIGYFKSGALFPTVYQILTVLLALHALSAFLIFRKTEFPSSVLSEMAGPSVAEKAASMVASIAMLLTAVASAVIYWINPLVQTSVLHSLGIISAFLSVFFFLFFWIPSSRGKTLHILLGYTLIFHFLYILCTSYFELFTPMNNPVKLLVQLCAIGSVLFLLGDLRFFLNKAKPAFFLMASTASIGFSSISVLSGGFFRLPTEEYTVVYHVYNVALFALLVYATVRTVRFLSLCRQAEELLISDSGEESSESTAADPPSKQPESGEETNTDAPQSVESADPLSNDAPAEEITHQDTES